MIPSERSAGNKWTASLPSPSSQAMSIPLGTYVKWDGGVRFEIHGNSPQYLTHDGTDQPIEMLESHDGSHRFRISWRWGSPIFRLTDGALVENEEHVFYRHKEGPEEMRSQPMSCAPMSCAPMSCAPMSCAQPDKLLQLRDSGYMLLHDILSLEEIRIGMASDAVKSLFARIPSDPPRASLPDSSADSSPSASPSTSPSASRGEWLEAKTSDASVLDLIRPIWPLVLTCLGHQTTFPTEAQLALKLPGDCTPQRLGSEPPDAHIDGMHSPGNGVPKGEVHNFTLIVGIALTDAPTPNSGNLGVYPGSHRAIARRIEQIGIQSAMRILTKSSESATGRLKRLVKLEGLAAPTPLCWHAGAAVVAHYQTVHFVMPHCGREPRLVAYFRITSGARRGGTAFGGRGCPEAMTWNGMLRDMPGIAALQAHYPDHPP